MTKTKKTNGFGLLEVLIASSIILIVILSLAAVSNSTLRSTYQIDERAQAINLAQEGIEVVRQIRDTNWIDQKTETKWSDIALVPGFSWTNVGAVSPASRFSIGFNDGLAPNRLYLYHETGASQTVTLNGSKFTRMIFFDNVGSLVPGVTCDSINPSDKSGCAIKATATVITPSGTQFSVSEVLTNWRPNY